MDMDARPDAQLGAFFETFFELAGNACCVVEVGDLADLRGPQLRLRRANTSFKAFAQAHGLVQSAGGPDALHVEPQWRELVTCVATTGEQVRASLVLGQACWFEVQGFAIPAWPTAVGLRVRDITEHRREVQRLIGLRRISTVGVMSWGEGFSLLDVNEGFLRITGWQRAEALGMTWQELTPQEFHPASEVAVQQVMALGEATPYEKQYYRKDGSRWWGLFAPRKIGDEVMEFVLDVTERRHAEAALRAVDQRKDVFLATLAHELRNPLAPIRNGIQILQLTTTPGPAVRRTLDILDRQLKHLIRLVDDLLDVARINSGKVRVVQERVALREVVGRSLESVEASLDAKQHQLRVALPGEEAYVLGDPHRLAQVFSNLLSNAVKYTPSGGQIEVTGHLTAGTVEVCVSDTGVGIPQALQAQVFELFSKVSAHQAHWEGGLGIGLALVDSLVRLHGGQVEVHSRGAGQGSTFRVVLPRAAD